MLRNLLICGLIAGACAGLLATGFAELAGEPAVDQAIAYEEAQSAGAPPAHEVELVPRDIQRSAGLITAAVVYGLAIGGLFALAFAAVYGRVGRASPARTALWLAGGAFVVVYLVPFLKYPANPPAVGNPDTIDRRTALFFVMVLVSLFAAVAAVRIRGWLRKRGLGTGALAAAVASYLGLVIVAALALPGVHEVPATFPATTLWRFREASIGMQLVLWATIGIVFALGAERVMRRAPGSVRAPVPAPAGD